MNLYYLYDYHKKWLVRGLIPNDNFDAISQKILDFKNLHKEAICFFTSKIIEAYDSLQSDNVIQDGFHCVAVPSHKPANTQGILQSNPMYQIISKLCEQRNAVYNADILLRVKEIPKLSTGGDRSIEVHLGSIEVANPLYIASKNILLFDDVCTTGNSLRACESILRNAGAKKVIALVLAQTVSDKDEQAQSMPEDDDIPF